MEQFPPDDILESLYKLSIRGSEKIMTRVGIVQLGDSFGIVQLGDSSEESET